MGLISRWKWDHLWWSIYLCKGIRCFNMHCLLNFTSGDTFLIFQVYTKMLPILLDSYILGILAKTRIRFLTLWFLPKTAAFLYIMLRIISYKGVHVYVACIIECLFVRDCILFVVAHILPKIFLLHYQLSEVLSIPSNIVECAI